jgi:hypothetical protein
MVSPGDWQYNDTVDDDGPECNTTFCPRCKEEFCDDEPECPACGLSRIGSGPTPNAVDKAAPSLGGLVIPKKQLAAAALNSYPPRH